MKVIDCRQRSPEWTKARLGMLTGSCVDEMLATRRDGKEAAGRRNLRMRLVLERITGRCLESDYVSSAMQQGMNREADAAAAYEAETGLLLRTVGFCAHDELMTGYSPDGVFGDFDGIAEIKAPIPATHWEYLRTGVIPTEYYRQILHGLFITGARWCDWLSFNPDFPEPLRVKMVRVERNLSEMNFHEVAVRAFLREVDEEYAAVQRMAMGVVAA